MQPKAAASIFIACFVCGLAWAAGGVHAWVVGLALGLVVAASVLLGTYNIRFARDACFLKGSSYGSMHLGYGLLAVWLCAGMQLWTWPWSLLERVANNTAWLWRSADLALSAAPLSADPGLTFVVWSKVSVLVSIWLLSLFAGKRLRFEVCAALCMVAFSILVLGLLQEHLLGWRLPYGFVGIERDVGFRGTFAHPNQMASFFGLAGFAALSQWLAPSKVPEYLRRIDGSRPWLQVKSFWVLGAAIGLGGVVLCEARGALVLTAAMAVGILAMRAARFFGANIRYDLLAVAASCVGLGLVCWAIDGGFPAEIWPSKVWIWRQALDAMAYCGSLGCGLGAQSAMASQVFVQDWAQPFLISHMESQVLQLGVDLGPWLAMCVLGGGAFVCLGLGRRAGLSPFLPLIFVGVYGCIEMAWSPLAIGSACVALFVGIESEWVPVTKASLGETRHIWRRCGAIGWLCPTLTLMALCVGLYVFEDVGLHGLQWQRGRSQVIARIQARCKRDPLGCTGKIFAKESRSWRLLHPGDPVLYRAWSAQAMRLDGAYEALELAQKGLARRPHDAGLLWQAGEALMRLGQKSLAMTQWRAALALPYAHHHAWLERMATDKDLKSLDFLELGKRSQQASDTVQHFLTQKKSWEALCRLWEDRAQRRWLSPRQRGGILAACHREKNHRVASDLAKEILAQDWMPRDFKSSPKTASMFWSRHMGDETYLNEDKIWQHKSQVRAASYLLVGDRDLLPHAKASDAGKDVDIWFGQLADDVREDPDVIWAYARRLLADKRWAKWMDVLLLAQDTEAEKRMAWGGQALCVHRRWLDVLHFASKSFYRHGRSSVKKSCIVQALEGTDQDLKLAHTLWGRQPED